MNKRYQVVVERGGTHKQGLMAELSDLSGSLSFSPSVEEIRAVQKRLLDLSSIIRDHTGSPTPDQIDEACRLLRSTPQRLGWMPGGVVSALMLLEG